jgi:hypothetical protein
MTPVDHSFCLVEFGEAGRELFVGVTGFFQQRPKGLDDEKGPAQSFIQDFHRSGRPRPHGCGCRTHPGADALTHHILGYHRKHRISLRFPAVSG